MLVYLLVVSHILILGWNRIQLLLCLELHRSSGMEAKMEDRTLGEDSRKKGWKDLFRTCPEARGIILDRIDLESALACRLVCKDWRDTVNNYKKLWAEINQVFSKANYLEYLKRGSA